jgi:hypothetical protein
MNIRALSIGLVALGIGASPTWAQETNVTKDVKEGRELAVIICSNCHVVSHDQSFEPILRPPAPSFESIAQRNNISADSVQTFLTTTHRNAGDPKGMPNPQLIDVHAKQVAAYLLSLRKQP